MSKLFKIINDIDNSIGLYANNYSIKQEDTSQFDNNNDDDDDNNNNNNKGNNNIILMDAEIKVLRRHSKKVKHEIINDKKVMLVVRDKNNYNTDNVVKFENNQPQYLSLLDWDKEISEVMHNDVIEENDDDDIELDKYEHNRSIPNSNRNDNTKFFPRAPSLKLGVTLIAGMDEDDFNNNKVIDAIDETTFLNSSVGDPLDTLIPNPILYSDNEEDDDQFKVKQKSHILPKETTSSSTPKSEKKDKEKLSQLQKLQKIQQMKIERVQDSSKKGINYDDSASTSTGALSKRLKENLRAKVKSVLGNFKHHNIANTNKNTKMDLTSIEVRYFHRPRLPESLKKKKWVIDITKSINTKKINQSSNNSRPTSEAEKLDLSIVNGNFICVEFMEELPPLIQNYGMGSSIYNYYRSYQKDDDNRLKKSRFNSLVSTDTRLPKHLQLLLEHRSTRSSNNFDVNAPRLEIGETKVLSPEENSPFLVPIIEGEQIQSMVNTLYRAPIFDHKASKSDFILVKIKSITSSGGIDKSIMTFAMREIPRVFVLGQVEPQRIVPKPKPKAIPEIQEKMFKLSAARYLQMNDQKGADFVDIQKYVLKHSMQKSNYRDSNLKKLLKTVADEVDLATGKKWFPKETWDDDFDRVTPEDLEKQFSPEDVAAIESCNAAELRLHELGIVDIDLTRIAQYCSRMLKWKFFKEGRLEVLKKLMKHESKGPRREKLEKLISYLIDDVKKLKKKMDVAQFIFDRLVCSPWNTTEAYVKSQLEPDGNGKMEITGQGDPSGRGEAFAFVRLVKETSKLDKREKAGSKDKLTKLHIADAIRKVVELTGLPRPVVSAMGRWERIDIIREYSTRAALAGKVGYENFARTSTSSAELYSQNLYKESLRKVWDLQKESLRYSIMPSLPDPEHMDIGKNAENEDEFGNDAKSDEDDELDLEIERVLASRAATNIDDPTATGSSSSKQNALTRAVIEEEENELKELKDNSFFNSLSRQSNTTRFHARISTDDQGSVPTPVSAYPEGWTRPQKVVKSKESN